MNLLWHEGALGDLLLSRLAIAALGGEETLLLARSEARILLREAGLVHEVASTDWGPGWDRSPPDTVYLFGESPFAREILSLRFPKSFLRIIRTRPRRRIHVALFQWLEVGEAPFALERAGILRPPGFYRSPECLLVHPGSGGRSKCYPVGDLKEALRRLGEIPLRVILGPAEEDLVGEFSGFSVIRSRTLDEALYALSRAAAFLGNDSGLTHLAAALGVPVLALFGPTDPVLWAPFGGRVRVLYPFTRLSPQALTREIGSFLNTIPRFRRREGCPPGGRPPEGVPKPPEAGAEGPWGAGEPGRTGTADETAKPDSLEGPAGLRFLGVEAVEVVEAGPD